MVGEGQGKEELKENIEKSKQKERWLKGKGKDEGNHRKERR